MQNDSTSTTRTTRNPHDGPNDYSETPISPAARELCDAIAAMQRTVEATTLIVKNIQTMHALGAISARVAA